MTSLSPVGGSLAQYAPVELASSVLEPFAAVASENRLPVVALVGRPNVGKSTFIARVTGRYEEAANVPGTTVGVLRRTVEIGGRDVVLVDLPGSHSMTDQSDGLPPFWQLLLDARPDAVLAVVDAGDLAMHLPLVLACRDLGLPIVVAANLADEAAAHGIALDLGRLSQLLAAPVHRTVGRRGIGVQAALDDAVALARRGVRASGRDDARPMTPVPPYSPAVVRSVGAMAARLRAGESPVELSADLLAGVRAGTVRPIAAATLDAAARLEPERWAIAGRWAAEVETRGGIRQTGADRLGRIVTSPRLGLPLFVVATLSALWLTMTVGTRLAEALSAAWTGLVSPVLTTVVETVVPIPVVAATVLWALDSGLLSMLAVGIPFVLTFYVVIAALEDSGYLASTAVLSDRVFNALGLPGRAAIPLLAATGCNVPAIYATRVLHSRRERLLASFLASLTPCSASSAVIIAALVPYAGMGTALAAFGVVALVTVVAGLGANAIIPGRQSPLVLELPPLRLPIPRQVLAKAWHRFRSFVTTATPVMLGGSLVIGALYETGAIRPIELLLAPVSTGLLGLPPVAGIALALAVLRKELALQLLLVLAIAEYGEAARSLNLFLVPGQLFVFAVVTGLLVPCAATIGALAGEFGWRPFRDDPQRSDWQRGHDAGKAITKAVAEGEPAKDQPATDPSMQHPAGKFGMTLEKLIGRTLEDGAKAEIRAGNPINVKANTVQAFEREYLVIEQWTGAGTDGDVERFQCMPLYSKDEWASMGHESRFGRCVEGIDQTDEARDQRQQGGEYCGKVVKIGRSKAVIGPVTEALWLVCEEPVSPPADDEPEDNQDGNDD